MINNRRAAMIAVSVAIFAGVALIAVGEVLEWGWTRLIGAGIISLAAVLLGALLGWSEPLRPRLANVVASWATLLVTVLALIVVVPLLFGFIAMLGGMIVRAASVTWHLLLAGVAITLLFFGLAVLATLLGLSSAFEGLRTTHPESENGDLRGSDE
jgi:hypothetical protein